MTKKKRKKDRYRDILADIAAALKCSDSTAVEDALTRYYLKLLEKST